MLARLGIKLMLVSILLILYTVGIFLRLHSHRWLIDFLTSRGEFDVVFQQITEMILNELLIFLLLLFFVCTEAPRVFR